MSKQVQIGSDIFIIPEAGENPGWGEDLTDFFEAVVEALETVEGPNDITITSATLANNQTTPADVPGFLFNAAQVQAINARYLVIRTYNAGSTVETESGKITGNYDGTDFYIAVESVGDVGIDLSITSGGQIQYTTTDLTNHVSTVIRFEAQTIDQ